MKSMEDRFREFVAKAEAGSEMTVGFLGGSITQGSLSSTPETCYAYLVYDWFRKRFPKAVFHYVNAGIGGTSSHFGVARAVSDLLIYQPDLVIVDFSVNDDPGEFFKETYEGLMRRLLEWESQPVILALNNVFYDTGDSAEAEHVAVTDYYGIPHVSVKDGDAFKQIQAGTLERTEISPDGLHPNDKGHALLAKQCTDFIDLWISDLKNAVAAGASEPKSRLDDAGKRNGVSTEWQLPEPMTENAYQAATRLTILNSNPKLAGFRADTKEKQGHLDIFANGWIGKKVGDAIRFEVDASCIAIQYRKTIRKPAPVAVCVLDGDEAGAFVLDANFAEDWGDCLYLTSILHHGVKTLHTVEIRIVEANATVEDFYLNSIITD